MARWKRFGLALTFAATFGSGVLMPRTADAFTLTDGQCAYLTRVIGDLEKLQAAYPNNRLIAYLLSQLQQLFVNGGCS